jgi:hypothetical protein
MHKAGLSDQVIMSKIQSSDTAFQTGPQDLIQLKDAGVSDPLINLMVQKSSH